MKKLFCALTFLTLILSFLTACASKNDRTVNNPPEDNADRLEKTRIVCTIFPEYDWVRQILGDQAGDVELTLLLDTGVDLHNYQPTVDDMVKISNCDLFIHVGGESDKWVKDALAEVKNQDMREINLLDAKEEEVVEGMQEEREEAIEETQEASEQEDGSGAARDAESETEYDEHVWLSLKNAQLFCGVIADALSDRLPERAAVFAENLAAYQARLADLDARYQAAVNAAAVKTLLFGDRFPFRDDYGLRYYAAFAGCSAETEASFETVIFLANKVDELNLPAVLRIDGGDGKIARTIVENTAAKSARILQMDSLQSKTARDVADGATYLDAMESNLDVLREALTQR